MTRFAVLLVAVVCLRAQNPRGMFPWWESPVVKDLNLSDDQSTRIRDALREHRGIIIDLRAAMEKAELDVEDGFNSEPVDQRRVTDAMERLIRARGDMLREYSKVALRLRVVLTPQQWKELQRRTPNPPEPRFPGQGAGPRPGMRPAERPGLPPQDRPRDRQ